MTLWKWPFEEKNQINAFEFKEYAGLKIFFILFPILKGIFKKYL